MTNPAEQLPEHETSEDESSQSAFSFILPAGVLQQLAEGIKKSPGVLSSVTSFINGGMLDYAQQILKTYDETAAAFQEFYTQHIEKIRKIGGKIVEGADALNPLNLIKKDE